MIIGRKVSDFLEKIDKFMDVCGLSVVNNLVNCVTKTCIGIYRRCVGEQTLQKNRGDAFLGKYFQYIDDKDNLTCALGLVPVLGSVFIRIKNAYEKPKYPYVQPIGPNDHFPKIFTIANTEIDLEGAPITAAKKEEIDDAFSMYGSEVSKNDSYDSFLDEYDADLDDEEVQLTSREEEEFLQELEREVGNYGSGEIADVEIDAAINLLLEAEYEN